LNNFMKRVKQLKIVTYLRVYHHYLLHAGEEGHGRLSYSEGRYFLNKLYIPLRNFKFGCICGYGDQFPWSKSNDEKR